MKFVDVESRGGFNTPPLPLSQTKAHISTSAETRPSQPHAAAGATPASVQRHHPATHESRDVVSATPSSAVEGQQQQRMDEAASLNPLYPKVIHSTEDLAHHTLRLLQAYQLLKEIMEGTNLGHQRHPSHVTHREVVSLRASLEGTRSVTQQWIQELSEREAKLLQHPELLTEDDPEEEDEEGNGTDPDLDEEVEAQQDPLYRPPSPLPPALGSPPLVGISSGAGAGAQTHHGGIASSQSSSSFFGSSQSFNYSNVVSPPAPHGSPGSGTAGSHSHHPTSEMSSMCGNLAGSATGTSPKLFAPPGGVSAAGPTDHVPAGYFPDVGTVEIERLERGSTSGTFLHQHTRSGGIMSGPDVHDALTLQQRGKARSNAAKRKTALKKKGRKALQEDAGSTNQQPGAAEEEAEGATAVPQPADSSPKLRRRHPATHAANHPHKDFPSLLITDPAESSADGEPALTDRPQRHAAARQFTKTAVPLTMGKGVVAVGPPGTSSPMQHSEQERLSLQHQHADIEAVESLIRECDILAEVLEDHVEDSCIAKTWDPVYDIQLAMLNTPSTRHPPGSPGSPGSPCSPTGRSRTFPKSAPAPLPKPQRAHRPSPPPEFIHLPTVLDSPTAAHDPLLMVGRRLGDAASAPSPEAVWPSYWRIIVETPWIRRLELFTAGFFNFFVCCQVCVVMTLGLLIFPPWYIRAATALYIVYIYTLGRPKFPVKHSTWYRGFVIWKYFRDYFPVRLTIPVEVRQQFDPRRNYVFGYHPHAAHAFGALVTFGGSMNGLDEMLPGIECHLQTLRINFFVPFWRQFSFWMGMGDASYAGIKKTLLSGPGQSVCLAVGGAEESLFSRPRTNAIVLERRKGFIKAALETGSCLVPVYAFGETNTYEVRSLATSPTFYAVAQRVKRITGFMMPMICGRGPFSLVPLRRPIQIVVGAPIAVPEVPKAIKGQPPYKPSQKDIDHYHRLYVEALEKLYNEFCGVYDVGSEPLRIVK